MADISDKFIRRCILYFIQNDCLGCCRNKQRKVSAYSDVDVRKVGRVDSNAASYIYRVFRN